MPSQEISDLAPDMISQLSTVVLQWFVVDSTTDNATTNSTLLQCRGLKTLFVVALKCRSDQ